MLRAVALGAAVLLLGADPGITKRGNAIIEYSDSRITVVAGYEYAHRFHADQWLMFDITMRTKDRMQFKRTSFSIHTPENTDIPLAPEPRVVQDAATIKSMRQNARVWKRDLTVYFHDGPPVAYRLLAVPGDGVVQDDFETDANGPAQLTLLFESDSGHWPAGKYELRIDNGRVRAILPLELK